MTTSLSEGACAVLTCADPAGKVALTFSVADAWRAGNLEFGNTTPPDRPARPARPELKRPGEVPKRSTGPKGRLALVHSLAHIELNAIDLAWDIIARFGAGMPRAFYDDWVVVAVEEAQHYRDLAARLVEMGLTYGDMPAHDGLWEASTITADDLLARLALIPMTLEARGLDTTPQTCVKLRGNDDEGTAAILDTIFTDEIKHLEIGVRWFEHECAQRGLDPVAHYKKMLADRFTGILKPPFNMDARTQAGMNPAYLS